MILQALKQLTQRQAARSVPPPYYATLNVHWLCHINTAGYLERFERLVGNATPKKNQSLPGVPMMVPSVGRTCGVLPGLLYDKAEYVFGITDRPGMEDRVKLYRDAFQDLVDKCYATLKTNLHVEAVMLFLTGLRGHLKVKLPKDMLPGDKVTFSVNGVLPIELDDVRDFWRNQQNQRIGTTELAHCLVCGKYKTPMRVLSETLYGVPNSTKNRCALVSANFDATWHNGRKNTSVAPLCEECAQDFMRGGNTAISQFATTVGNLSVLTWADNPVKNFPMRKALNRPSPEVIAELETIVATEKEDFSPIHVLYLAARQGRGVVYGYETTTRCALAENVLRWYRAQLGTRRTPVYVPMMGYTEKIEDQSKRGKKFTKKITVPGLISLLTYDDNWNKLSIDYLVSLCNSALFGEPLSYGLFERSLRHFQYARYDELDDRLMAWLRLFNNDPRYKEKNLIDNVIDSVPYRCGKLLALLEQIQRKAIVNISRTIVDSFFRTAAERPAMIFGQILLRARTWLAKLEKKGPSYLSRTLAEALQGLHFPPIFTAVERANFCLGYYESRVS